MQKDQAMSTKVRNKLSLRKIFHFSLIFFLEIQKSIRLNVQMNVSVRVLENHTISCWQLQSACKNSSAFNKGFSTETSKTKHCSGIDLNTKARTIL